jgi:hypothetical protein
MAFSVRKNLRELLAGLPAEGDINCIYGVRALCTIALYLAHKVIILASSPHFNRVKLIEVRLFFLSLAATLPPIRWVPGALSPGVKWPDREATTHLHLMLSSRIMKLYIHSPTCLHGIVLN